MLRIGNNITVGKPIYKFHNNHSVEFDGIDDFIQLGEPLSYTQHTISTWVKVSDTGDSKTIIDARDANDDGIRIFVTSAEVVTYQLNTSDITSGSAISTDEWHHIVATYDGSEQKLYIDGSLVSSATTSQTISTTTNAEIGARNFSDRANEFLGKIDELAIYNRALEQEEVEKIFRIKYGANLVQNGRFDELGSELVDNGDFSSDSDWDLDTGWSITNGKLRSDGTGNSGAEQTGVFNTSGKTFKITFDVNVDSGTLNSRVRFKGTGNTTISNITSAGSYTFYAVSVASQTALNFVTLSTNTAVYSIDNVSVKQVDPNDRWSAGVGGASKQALTDVATLTVTGGFDIMLRQNGILTSGKKYKITYNTDLSGITSGSLKWQLFSDSSSARTILNGTNTVILTANGSDLYVSEGGASGTGIFTFIMVEEQKYVATNLKLNSIPYSSSGLKNYYRMGDGILDKFPLICDMVEPSFSSELITNGEFSNGNTGWSSASYPIDISGGVATFTITSSSYAKLTPSSQPNYIEGKVYKLTATVNGTSSKQMRFRDDTGNNGGLTSTTGKVTMTGSDQIIELFWFANANSDELAIERHSSGDYSFTVTNISLKEVNGVAGLMEGMSQSNITNDVPS